MVSGLMGASPGASVSVSIALETLEKCWPDRCEGVWKDQLKKMLPGYGQRLNENPELAKKIKKDTAQVLGMNKPM